uniref:Uncharacterized protein n=1 Tax=Rhizophora mucronata TaxID=61149 RepID=A0A2P2PUU8_RHIMU
MACSAHIREHYTRPKIQRWNNSLYE